MGGGGGEGCTASGHGHCMGSPCLGGWGCSSPCLGGGGSSDPRTVGLDPHGRGRSFVSQCRGGGFVAVVRMRVQPMTKEAQDHRAFHCRSVVCKSLINTLGFRCVSCSVPGRVPVERKPVPRMPRRLLQTCRVQRALRPVSEQRTDAGRRLHLPRRLRCVAIRLCRVRHLPV